MNKMYAGFSLFVTIVAVFSSILPSINGSKTKNLWDRPIDQELKTEIFFETPFAKIPIVSAWARAESTSSAEFEVEVVNVDTTKLDAIITRTDVGGPSWNEPISIYYSVTEVSENSSEQSISLFGGPLEEEISIPPAVWVFAPAIVQSSPNIIEMMGQQVHISTVKKMLVENTEINFPINETTNSADVKLELLIRADTVYVDSSVNFRGLKNVKIIARKFVSDEETFTLQAPEMCQTLSGTSCGYYGKAGQSNHGRNGNAGVDSPTVEFYIYEGNGQINLLTISSDGNRGEKGGDGAPGQDNTYESPTLSNSESCDRDCGGITDKKYYTGKPGPNGGDGEDGRRSGTSGGGGNSNPLILQFENLAGSVEITQRPGSSGSPSEHGSGGRAGLGGTGGCGKRCHNRLVCAIVCWPMCEENDDCDHRGPPGVDGEHGKDGFEVYGSPLVGDMGVVQPGGSVALKQNVRNSFVNDTELLKLIQRHGESLFQRNNNEEAKKVFSFLLYAADEASVLYQEVSNRLHLINQGFDYYGNVEEYAPDLDWSILSDRVDDLMDAGKAFEDAYNSIMDDVEDIELVSSTMHATTTRAIETEKSQLTILETELTNAKDLNVKALMQLEETMEKQIEEIYELVPLVIEQDEHLDTVEGFVNLIGGIAGFAVGLKTSNPFAAADSAKQIVGVLRAESCPAPSIEEATESIEERLTFGYEFKEIDPADFDFTTMNASAVPAIMLSDLAKNKAMFFHEMQCLFERGDTELVQNLERVVNDFFRDGALRITLIDDIMNIDVKLKTIGLNHQLLDETQATIDATVNDVQGSITMDVKLSFSDYLFNLYQTQENNIMEALYELSKAYQFSCLWDFHAVEKYNSLFSDIVITNNAGSLEGMVQLQNIKNDLEDERFVFLNAISSSAGPQSHTFTTKWEFNNKTHPEVIETLQTNGQFTIGMKLDPDEIASSICWSCYNARLEGLYIELSGEEQHYKIPKEIYIKVSHMGDSAFLVPSSGGGGEEIKTLQQTPENVDGGRVMSFDRNKPIQSDKDPILEYRFNKPEHTFCEDTDSFFGSKPCKSPFATYVITIPRSDALICSPDVTPSGINCQDLDFKKFNKVTVYTKTSSWSDYPVQPDAATMKSLVKSMRAARDQA